MARSLEARLARLEARARTHSDPSTFPPEIEAAKQRCLARLYRKIATALDAWSHPRVQWAVSLLRDDTPEQSATDLATLTRWGAAHPERLTPDQEGVCNRIMAKLEEMARRMEAQR